MEEGAEIQSKGIENLFNEIIAENYPNLCKYILLYANLKTNYINII
jgi:hypothetical protein